MNWLALHLRTLGQAMRRLARAPFSNLLTVLVIGVTLSLPAGLYAVLDNLRPWVGDSVGEPQLTLFLARNAGAQDIALLRAKLKAQAGVREALFVPRDQALKELLQNNGLQDMAATLEGNPLPDAFIVKPDVTKPAELEQLQEEMRHWPKVDTVQLDSAWARRLFALMQFGRLAVLLLFSLLGVALLAVSGNTIRLQILSRREEIEVSQLIGATDSFIRRPFLYFGALQGLGGGIVAWIVVEASLRLLDSAAADLAQLYGSALHLHGLPLSNGLCLLLLSTALGWLGAFVAATRYLRHSPVVH
ncbi:MAG: permease-like cell division protein FtsX [Burkholderiales bacterium]